MTREEEARAGLEAATEFKRTEAIFAGLEEALLAQMMATNVEDSHKRDKLFFAIKALRGAKAMLLTMAANAAAISNYDLALAEHGFTSPRP